MVKLLPCMCEDQGSKPQCYKKKKKLEKDLLVVSYLICITTCTQSFLKDINIYRIVAYCMLVKTSEGPEV